MFVVIFESWPQPDRMQRYLDMGAALGPRIENHAGFVSIERFKSVTDPDKLVALSFWRDEASIDSWRKADFHRAIQASSRDAVFRDYRLRVAGVIRDYGKHDRAQAPRDSRSAIG